VIVIDGGSDDGSIDILRHFDDSIDYWISEPDQGIYDAMNKGIAAATGKFVLHLNAETASASFLGRNSNNLWQTISTSRVLRWKWKALESIAPEADSFCDSPIPGTTRVRSINAEATWDTTSNTGFMAISTSTSEWRKLENRSDSRTRWSRNRSAWVFQGTWHVQRAIQRGATKLRDSICLARPPLALHLAHLSETQTLGGG